VDGRAFVVYKVTNPSPGVWHYEYAVHNQNLDRAIQSFSIPLGCGITLSNVGFHAPPNHPGYPNDGTVGDAGLSNAAWSVNQTSSAISWNTETLAQNPNANAIRWGTLYNFRFDSHRPPQAANATVGFFKTGAPIMVPVQGPGTVGLSTPCSPLQLVTAVSGKTHGSAGAFEIDLPLSGPAGVESRDGGGNHTVTFTFSNNIAGGNASVTAGTGSVAGSAVIAGHTLTVNLTGVANAQALTLNLANVTDTLGQTLPDTSLPIRFLIGDTNGDGSVNAGDALQTRGRAGQAADATSFRSDCNVDGFINTGDTLIVRSRAGSSVP
jgi:hypothetical protein